MQIGGASWMDDHLKKKIVRRQMACKYCSFHTGCRVAVTVDRRAAKRVINADLLDSAIIFCCLELFFLLSTVNFFKIIYLLLHACFLVKALYSNQLIKYNLLVYCLKYKKKNPWHPINMLKSDPSRKKTNLR